MRTLVFKVDGQKIYPNSASDIGGLVAGTSGYVRAKFLFSDDWNGCAKVAAFNTVDGLELTPSKIYAKDFCCIPDDALEYHEFEMSVLGKGKDGYTIRTRPIRIKQYGGIK